MLLSLYLHFPFCKQKCLYCDFCSAPREEETIRAYCHALEEEIRREGKLFPDTRVNTVFFGGGTPSLVPPDAMAGVLSALRQSFVFQEECEFSSEANPGTLTGDWLDVMLGGGMNRLSMGMQAAQDRILRTIGRIHTMEDTREAVQLARAAGIGNLNLDLMYGLPGQSVEDFSQTLAAALSFSPEHISAYSLIPEPGTPLVRLLEEGKLSLPDEDMTADMADLALTELEKRGYEHYEISNYARKGFRCLHNMGYWQGAWYLGLGTAAHSCLPPRREGDAALRRANTLSTEEYLQAARTGQWEEIRENQPVTFGEAVKESIMLSLRTADGLREADFTDRFGFSFMVSHEKLLEGLIRDGLGKKTAEGFALTPRGLSLQNTVLLRFPEFGGEE